MIKAFYTLFFLVGHLCCDDDDGSLFFVLLSELSSVSLLNSFPFLEESVCEVEMAKKN